MTTPVDSSETPPYNPAQDDDKMRATMVDPGAGMGFPSRWVRCMAAEILNLKAARNAGIDAQHELHEQLYQARLALTASEKRRRETDMLAYKWMVAHDRLAAGLQYEFPSPANIPDALARVNELETFVRSVQVPTKDGTWKEVMFRLADEARVILAKGERS